MMLCFDKDSGEKKKGCLSVIYSMYLSDSAAPEKWREEEKWTEEEWTEKEEKWKEEHTQMRRSEGGIVCWHEGEGEADADAGGGLWRGGMSVR